MSPLAAFDELETSDSWPMPRIIGIVGIFVALAVLSIVLGTIELPAFPLLIPMQMTGVMVLDGISAFLLLSQFWHQRVIAYVILAAAYLFAALIAVPFLLTFPGLTADGHLIVGGPQSSIWLWQAWHLVFPSLIGISIYLHRRQPRLQVAEAQIARHTLTMIALTMVGVALIVAVVVIAKDQLPILLVQNTPHPLTHQFFAISLLEVLVSVVAIALVWPLARQGSLLHQWLLIALVAFLGEIVASMSADHRYTLGWYISRFQGLAANGVVMLVLLGETSRIYRRLRLALAQARDDRTRLWKDTQSLRISEERYRLLATGIHDHAFYMLDANGRIMTWNAGAERMKGYQAPQVKGRTIGLFSPPEDVANKCPEALLNRARALGRAEEEGWRVRKDGSRFPAKISVTALHDAKGELAGYGVITHDLSENHHDNYNGLIQVPGGRS